jgi:hypothetical protein
VDDGNRDRKSNQERSSRRARRALDQQQAVPGRYRPSFTERYTIAVHDWHIRGRGWVPTTPGITLLALNISGTTQSTIVQSSSR